MVVAVAIDAASRQLAAAVNTLVTAAMSVVIVRGIVRLLRERGVTWEAVADALAMDLSIGLAFAWPIELNTQVVSTPYFGQQTAVTEEDLVYLSFTVLTTTGLCAFSPRNCGRSRPCGDRVRTAQLYLVTVIRLLIANF